MVGNSLSSKFIFQFSLGAHPINLAQVFGRCHVLLGSRNGRHYPHPTWLLHWHQGDVAVTLVPFNHIEKYGYLMWNVATILNKDRSTSQMVYAAMQTGCAVQYYQYGYE